MKSYVLFKDNHEEPIMWYYEGVNEIVVDTPSGKYMFHSKTITHPSGFKYLEHNFYRYLYEKSEWVVTKDIIKFYLAKEEPQNAQTI